MGNTVIHVEKNMGITHALKKFVKDKNMTMSDGFISSSELDAAMDKIDEIQDKRKAEGKESIFRGGRERGAGTDWHSNYVVDEGDLTFTEDEMNSIYKALGVSFSTTTSEDPTSIAPAPTIVEPEEPSDSTGVVTPPVVTDKPDTTIVAPPVKDSTEVAKLPTEEDATAPVTEKKKPNWLAIGAATVAVGAAAMAIVSHKNAKQAMDTARQAMEKVDELGTKVQGLEGKVSGLETTVQELGSKVNELGGKVNELGGKIGNLEQNVTNIQQTVNNINVTNIQQNVTQIVNNATSNSINKIQNAANQAGQDAVNAINQATSNSITQIQNAANQAGQNAVNTINQAGQNAVNTVNQATSNSITQIQNTANQAINDIHNTAGQVINPVHPVNPGEVTNQEEIETIIARLKKQHQLEGMSEAELEELARQHSYVPENFFSGKSAKESAEVFEAEATARQNSFAPENFFSGKSAKESAEVFEAEATARQNSFAPENFFSGKSAKESAEVFEEELAAAETRFQEAEELARRNSYVPENFFSGKSAKESAEVFETNAKQQEEILIEAMNKKNQEISSILNSIENNHTGATTQEVREAVAKAEKEAAKLSNLKEGIYEYNRNGNFYIIEVGKDGKVKEIVTEAGNGLIRRKDSAKELTQEQIQRFINKNPDALKEAMAA